MIDFSFEKTQKLSVQPNTKLDTAFRWKETGTITKTDIELQTRRKKMNRQTKAMMELKSGRWCI
jgi:hypothetical protein